MRQSDRWWSNPGFYFQLIAIVVTIGGGLWTIAEKVSNTVTAVTEMRGQLEAISKSVSAMALSNNSIEKDQAFQKTQIEALQRDKDVKDAWVAAFTSRLAKMEAELDSRRRGDR